MKFHMNNTVRIKKTHFYYGMKGTVKDYKQNKDGTYEYLVKINLEGVDKEFFIAEKDLYTPLFNL